MARISYADADKYGASETNWLKLTDNGDSALVQFMNKDMNDLDVFAVHKVKMLSKEGREYDAKVSCLREYGDPIDACPFCAAGMKPTPSVMLAMVDVEDNSVKIWERGKTFIPKLQNMCNRYNPFNGTVFEIVRNGKKGDQGTTYDVLPVPGEEPINVNDFERPEFLGTMILEKTPEDMEYYLQRGSFPQAEQAQQETAAPQRRRREAAPEQSPSQGRTRRGAR